MLGVALGCGLLVVSCSGGDDSSSGRSGTTAVGEPDGDEQRFPDVVAVEVERDGDVYDFEVTISSPYDTADRYADGWRIIGAHDGSVYGEHELGHDHANEQPFTRTQRGVSIPAGVDEVVVEARDSDNGYGGQTVTVMLGES